MYRIRRFNHFFKLAYYDDFEIPLLSPDADSLECSQYLLKFKNNRRLKFLRKNEQLKMSVVQLLNKPSKLITYKKIKNLKFIQSKLFFFEPFNLVVKKKKSDILKKYLANSLIAKDTRLLNFYKKSRKKKIIKHNYIYNRDLLFNNNLSYNDVSDDEIDDELVKKIKLNWDYELPELKKSIKINTNFSNFNLNKSKKLRHLL